jgi:hypothetical protein
MEPTREEQGLDAERGEDQTRSQYHRCDHSSGDKATEALSAQEVVTDLFADVRGVELNLVHSWYPMMSRSGAGGCGGAHARPADRRRISAYHAKFPPDAGGSTKNETVIQSLSFLANVKNPAGKLNGSE